MNFDPNKDYYGILGVTPTAELAVIKAAYKVLATVSAEQSYYKSSTSYRLVLL